MSNNPTACFLTYDWSFGTKPLQPNGCGWYRCYLPMKELERNGWDSAIGFPGWNEEHGFGLLVPDKKAIHGWDVIVFKLIMLESVASKMIEAKEMGQKIVVDIDDWFEGLEKTNMLTKNLLIKIKNSLKKYGSKADRLISSAEFILQRDH